MFNIFRGLGEVSSPNPRNPLVMFQKVALREEEMSSHGAITCNNRPPHTIHNLLATTELRGIADHKKVQLIVQDILLT